MTTYIANQSIGEVRTGGEVTGLPDDRTKFLLEKGVIREATADELKELKADAKPDAETEAPDVDDADYETVDFESLTVAQLKDLLEQKGIDHANVNKKADLIKLFK